EFNNKSIRGRVQDRDTRIEPEPMFVLSFYSAPTELRQSTAYMREIEQVNDTRVLSAALQLLPNPPVSDEETANRHFRSIERATQFLATHQPRAIDYFSRAMDFYTVRDYQQAVADLTKAISLTPDFALAYFARGIARFNLRQAGGSENLGLPHGPPASTRAELREMLADFDTASKLSPHSPYPVYNKGVALAAAGDFTAALACFNKAVELKPDFGEAYYNRGCVFFQLGNNERGSADLSKAGELGVVPSYNLLKRMKPLR
ncbi:MAG: tetratricopeptide repeat protein, partial [Muribaculaceae bacterium]|nr:tetratricopeptide repeat protein [Muribaculaceae bacterium]